MLAFFKKHFGALLVGVAINVPSLFRGIVWLTDWLARLDFWVTHGKNLSVPRVMIDILVNPPAYMVFVTSIVGVGIVLWDVRNPNTFRNLKSGLLSQKNRMAILVSLSIVCFTVGVGFAGAAYWSYKYPPPPPPPEESALLKAARQDFQNSGGVAEQTEVFAAPAGYALPSMVVTIWVRSDLISMAKYLVLYIPRGFDAPFSPPLGGISHFPRQTYEAVKGMADRFPDVIKRVDSTGSAGLGDMGADNMRFSTEAPFTGAIYIYHEADLSDAERVELRAVYQSRGARAFFRGWRYLRESRAPVAN